MMKLLACLALLTAWCSAGAAQPSASGTRPNIIVILLDDMGFSDIGCYGGEIQTPNVDRLASQGIRFTQFYNASKCEASRTAILSGLSWPRAGRGIVKGVTLGQAMRQAGYATFAVGKWHVDGDPFHRGFDRSFGHLSGATDYFRGDDTFRLDDQPYKIPDKGFYTTDANTDFAIQFLTEERKKTPDKPFFLYLAYNAPHSPLQAPAEDVAKYRGKYLAGWDRIREERYQRQIALGVIKKEWPLSPRPSQVPPWDALTDRQKQIEDGKMATYAAMIDRVDQNIGRLLDALRSLGVEDNTLILFLSDNGGNPFDQGDEAGEAYGVPWANVSNTPFRYYKRNQHEGGISTPLIACWPAIIKDGGTITDQPGDIVDIMATVLDAAGGRYPTTFEDKPVPPMDGLSLLPILTGGRRPAHDALFFQQFDHRGVRQGDWKLAAVNGGPWELYRLDKDRTELHDLASAQPDKVKELDSLWNQWWETTNGKPYVPNTKTGRKVQYRGELRNPTPAALPENP